MVIGKGEVRGAVTPESGMSHRGGRRRVLHGAERLEHEAADAHQRADLGGAAGELPEHARDGGTACAPLRTAPDGGRAGLGASARLRRRRAAGEGRRRPPLQRRARHRLLQACKPIHIDCCCDDIMEVLKVRQYTIQPKGAILK